ncbi:hypothetical protein [Flavobacterium limi]|uniref:Uncharacterized protein n=1 Tax=Flavobacterium limi TaxID=2045105 RepID=A0ABQ1UVX1_9FLAO|nr:hypothetical protein [Flavobacterium limi]GGF28383.1 hypothetical protein GCM10011518_42140 [Flavobacterium limi]
MPWYNGDYPPSYKNQPIAVREKGVEIANALLTEGAEEGVAIATGLKQARLLLENHSDQHALEPSDLYVNQLKIMILQKMITQMMHRYAESF